MSDLIIGILVGVITMWLLYTGTRRHIKIVEQEKALLRQEKQILFEFMHNLVEAVGEGRGREALFERIVHEAIVSTGANSAALYEKTGDGCLRSVAAEGLFPPQGLTGRAAEPDGQGRSALIEAALKPEILEIGEGLVGGVARSRKAVLIANADGDPRVLQHADPALHVHSIIVAPILFRDELIGVLAVADRTDGLEFNDNDFSLVRSLAEQVGLAIQNCDVLQIQIEKNRLDIDLEIAGSVQGMLLPHTFPLGGRLDIAAAYRPARKIGGDLYDLFELPGERLGVAIADVSGKGIPASLLMAICQSELGNQAQHNSSPAEVLRRVNARICGRLHRDMFITMIFAIIDLAESTITFARAGHEPPMLLAAEHGAGDGRIDSEGMAIGLVPPAFFDSTIADCCVPFGPGDSFLLYTDGVTETVDPAGEEFGAARLAGIARDTGHLSAQETVDHVLAALERFSANASPPDDITLLAVRNRREPRAEGRL